MTNIWSKERCLRPDDKRCNACCVATLCPKVSEDGCSDYLNRPDNCKAFYCGNSGVEEETKARLRQISEEDY